MIEKTASSLSVLVVVRYEREGPFDQEAHRRMRLLAPHLRRAVTIGRVIDLKTLEAADFAATLDSLAVAIFLSMPRAASFTRMQVVNPCLNGEISCAKSTGACGDGPDEGCPARGAGSRDRRGCGGRSQRISILSDRDHR